MYPRFYTLKELRNSCVKPSRGINDGVNRNKLRQVIKSSGLTRAQLARAYGKSVTRISNKLAGRAPFRVGDMQFLKEYLNLSTAEAADIFFGRA
jgi:transcriptional regulator with XRE-family HTH domain